MNAIGSTSPKTFIEKNNNNNRPMVIMWRNRLLLLLTFWSALCWAGQPHVELTLYGESLCPFCKNWILAEAAPLFEHGFQEYISLRYVAWGNARPGTPEGGNPRCQHGPLECQGNDYINCAQAHYPDQEVWFPYVACLARQSFAGFSKALEGCTQGTELDPALLTACAKSSEAAELSADAWRETAALRPPHLGVPWPVINGVAQGAGSLRSYLCTAIPAASSRPDICFTAEQAPSRCFFATLWNRFMHRAAQAVAARPLLGGRRNAAME